MVAAALNSDDLEAEFDAGSRKINITKNVALNAQTLAQRRGGIYSFNN